MTNKSPKDLHKEANRLLTDIWGERDAGIEIPAIDWTKPISHADVLYLLSRYAYLQVINTEPVWGETVIPQFLKARSGWIIHDYGQAISSSPGRYLYGPGNPEVRDEEDGDSGEGGHTGRGSIIKQTFETAEAMIQIAIDKGWPGVEIISGTGLMKCAAWIIAQNAGYTLRGYTPSEKDLEKRDRILRAREALRRMAGPGISPSV